MRTINTQQNQRRRQQILTAARAVFNDIGCRRATMGLIAEAAHISKGLTYWYFRNKQALIETIIQEEFERDIAARAALLRQPGTLRERLLEYIAAQGAELERYRLIRRILHDCYARLCSGAGLEQTMADHLCRQAELMTALINQGIERGELRTEAPAIMAELLLSIEEGILTRWMMAPGRTDWRAQAVLAVNRLLSPCNALAANALVHTQPRGPKCKKQP